MREHWASASTVTLPHLTWLSPPRRYDMHQHYLTTLLPYYLAGMTCSSTGRRHRPLSVRRTRVGAGAVCKAPTLRIAILTKGVLTSYSPHTNLILT